MDDSESNLLVRAARTAVSVYCEPELSTLVIKHDTPLEFCRRQTLAIECVTLSVRSGRVDCFVKEFNGYVEFTIANVEWWE